MILLFFMEIKTDKQTVIKHHSYFMKQLGTKTNKECNILLSFNIYIYIVSAQLYQLILFMAVMRKLLDNVFRVNVLNQPNQMYNYIF